MLQSQFSSSLDKSLFEALWSCVANLILSVSLCFLGGRTVLVLCASTVIVLTAVCVSAIRKAQNEEIDPRAACPRPTCCRARSTDLRRVVSSRLRRTCVGWSAQGSLKLRPMRYIPNLSFPFPTLFDSVVCCIKSEVRKISEN